MKFLALTAGAAALALAAGPASAVQITQVIDDFFTPMEAEVVGAGFGTDSDFGPAVTAVGGARDLTVTKISGDDGERVRARINPSAANLLRMTIDDANGSVQVIWDGLGDGNLDFAGLGGLDFLIYDSVELVTTFSDIGGPVQFGFYDTTGASFAVTTFDVPGGIPAMSNVVLSKSLSLADFTTAGPLSLEQILGDVGLVAMFIDAAAPAQAGWDVRFDQIRLVGTSEVPLPAPAALLLLGLGGLGALRARRKAA